MQIKEHNVIINNFKKVVILIKQKLFNIRNKKHIKYNKKRRATQNFEASHGLVFLLDNDSRRVFKTVNGSYQ